MSTSNTTQLARDQQMIAGIQKHPTASWVIAGKMYSAQQALDVLQARVNAALAVPPAKATYANTVLAANTEISNTKQFVDDLRQATAIMFRSQVDTLSDFGIAPPKTRKATSVVQKVQAVELRKATRAVRHTMGKTEKAKLKGTAQVAITVTSPSTSSPATSAAEPVALPMASSLTRASSPQGS